MYLPVRASYVTLPILEFDVLYEGVNVPSSYASSMLLVAPELVVLLEKSIPPVAPATPENTKLQPVDSTRSPLELMRTLSAPSVLNASVLSAGLYIAASVDEGAV